MRTRSIAGVLALLLAVAMIGAGTAFAQTPKPKAEKPPTATKPPEATKPNAAKPKAAKPKAAKPPKAEPPNAEKPPKAQKPQAEKPAATPKRPTPAQPKPAQANAPSAQPNEPAPEPRGEVTTTVSPSAQPNEPAREPRGRVTTTVSPSPTTAPSLAASRASAASPEPSGTGSASSGGDSADAIPVARGRANAAPGREPRLATDDVTEATAVPVDGQQARLVTVDSLPGYNVPLLLLTLLLAIVFTVGLGYYIRRELRGSPRTVARRRQPRASPLRARTMVHAFSGRVGCSIAAWSAGTFARISTLRAEEHAMTKKRPSQQAPRTPGAARAPMARHRASRREAAGDRAQRPRTTVADRRRPLVAGRLSRRR